MKYIRCQINDEIETYLSKGHPFIGVKRGIEYYLNDKKITSVVIPSSITKLGKYAFQNCKDLTSVTVSWQTPISASTAFYGADLSKCTLYIPQGTEQDYWLADVWGDFGKIVEFDPYWHRQGNHFYRCQGSISLFSEWSAIVCSSQGLEHREV